MLLEVDTTSRPNVILEMIVIMVHLRRQADTALVSVHRGHGLAGV